MTGRDTEDGYALAAVLIIVSFLAILALLVSAEFRSRAKISRQEEASLHQKLLYQSALVATVVHLTDPNPDLAWQPQDEAYSLTIGDQEVSIRIEDELGKIDLNDTSEDLLGRYLGFFLSGHERDALLDAILDWRDADNQKRPSGAEAATYRAEGKSFLPSNQDFETVGELRWVRGMDDRLFECLAPGLTVHAQRDGVNHAAAHPVVREALGLDVKEAPQVAVSAIRGGLGGRAFRIVVQTDVEAKNAPHFAILRITENREEPFWILEEGRQIEAAACSENGREKS